MSYMGVTPALVFGFVNNDIIVNIDHVPHLNVLNAHISTRFGNITAALRRFFEALYDDGQNVRRPADLEVQPMNAREFLYICQVVLHNDHIDHYTMLRLRMSVLNGPWNGEDEYDNVAPCCVVLALTAFWIFSFATQKTPPKLDGRQKQKRRKKS